MPSPRPSSATSRGCAGEASSANDRLYTQVLQATGADPLPYGVEPNRAMLEQLIEYALAQRILTQPVAIDDMFAQVSASAG
jgi:4,5-dihydroxyphthalate decarboxylase